LFTVTGTRADGSSASPAVTWRSTGGTVDAGGYYVAPQTDATYGVIATTVDGALADSGAAVVTVAPSQEPQGYERISETAFIGIPLQGASLAGSWYGPSTANYSAVGSESPTGDNKVVRMIWPAGLPSGSSPGQFATWSLGTLSERPRYKEIYISFLARIEKPDFENQAVGTKLFYVGYGNTAQTNDAFLMLANGTGKQAVQSEMGLTMYVSASDDREGPSFPFNPNLSGAPKFRAGVWQHVEVLLKVGTPNNANGSVRVWLNGAPVSSHQSVKFLDFDYNFVQGFFEFKWAPVWGGVGGTRTRDDSVLLDRLYVSGLRQ
jgi:hypothetical protein